MQNHNAQKSIHASFKWYEKEVTGLFLSAKGVVQLHFVNTINWFSSFFFYFSYCIFNVFYFSYCIFNVFYLGYCSKIKEIMNVNRRIILVLVSKICYDKSMIMVNNYAPFYRITDPVTLIFVKGVIYMILHIWQAFRLSLTTFVRKVCMEFEYVCKPVFCEHNLPVEATYIHVTELGRKGPVTCFTKIHISLWLLGQIRWGLHWIVEKLW